MTILMNLANISLPNLGSGRMVRWGAAALRDMCKLLPGLYFLGRLAPYLDRPCRRSLTPAQSRAPRTVWYLTPGKSLTRPPRINTTECSCKLWPIPGMYAVTSTLVVKRTRATLRNAEFGFFGVVV